MFEPPSGFGSPAASAEAHRASAPASVRCAVLTVSDTRDPDTDTSGNLIREMLGFSGHTVVDYQMVPDEPDQIRQVLDGWIARDDVHAVVGDRRQRRAGRPSAA